MIFRGNRGNRILARETVEVYLGKKAALFRKKKGSLKNSPIKGVLRFL